MFKGSMVALVTPMQADGSIDKAALHNLVEWHIESKTDGIIVVGTTGEAPTLSPEEQLEIISLVVEQVNGRIPVIAGTGTNATQTTIKHTLNAQKYGADACLVVTPYYNKPNQNGLYQHFKMLAENTDIPLILYNVPGRTGCDLLPETIEKLAKITNIIGIKEATGKLDRVTDIQKRCGTGFMIYSGDDESSLDAMLLGAHGVISVTANVAPLQMHNLCEAALSGNKALAEKINADLLLLHKNLFLEANPIPVKWVVQEMGLIPAGIRLPLIPLDAQYHDQLRNAMRHAGIKQTTKEM